MRGRGAALLIGMKAGEARAEAAHANSDLLDRLDMLLVNLTEASRDVCTNTRCPHYGKKCKMR